MTVSQRFGPPPCCASSRCVISKEMVMSVVAAIAKQIFVLTAERSDVAFSLLSVVATKLNHKGALPRYVKKGHII